MTVREDVPTADNRLLLGDTQAVHFNGGSLFFSGVFDVADSGINGIKNQAISGLGNERYLMGTNARYKLMCGDEWVETDDYPNDRFFSARMADCQGGQVQLTFDSRLGDQVYRSTTEHRWAGQAEAKVSGLAAIELLEGNQQVTDQLVNQHQARLILRGYQDEQYTLSNVKLEMQLDDGAWAVLSVSAHQSISNAFEANLDLPQGRKVASLRLSYSTPSLESNVQTLNGFFHFGLKDADGDLLDDDWEAANGLDATNPGDAALDSDNDGLTNLAEFTQGTRPDLADSDADGVPDLADVDPLSAVVDTAKAIEQIRFKDSRLNGCINTAASDKGWQNLDEVTQLDCRTSQVSDLSGVRALYKLQKLYLSDNQLNDITALATLTDLTHLDLRKNQLADISALAGLTALSQLKLSKNQITDITPLASLTGLNFVSLSDNQFDASMVTVFASMPELSVLYLRNSGLVDLGDLAGLDKLTRLYLAGNLISDISPLAGLDKLTSLQLDGNKLEDIAPLAGLTGLTWLDMRRNGIKDVAVVADMTQLSTLKLSKNEVSDLTPLAGLTSLRFLSVSDNAFAQSELNKLSALTGLTTLYLRNSGLDNIDALSGMTALTRLYLKDNQLTDISPLANLTALQTLQLSNNAINDLSALSGLSKASSIDLAGNELSCAALDELEVVLGEGVIKRPQTCL